MNPISKISSTLCALILLPQIASSEPLPLKEGEQYHIKLSVESKKVVFWDPNKPVRIAKIYDYSWVEIEYTWKPSVASKSVKSKPKTYKRLLNLNHVVTIIPPKN